MSVTELHPDVSGSDQTPRDNHGQTESPRRQAPPGRRLLSASEEIALARRIERGDLEAKERMIESNLGLVLAIARTYRGSNVPFADLVQEGTVGLVRAVERFDHRRAVKFSTYAVWWIRRSMLDAITNANVIRIPAKANQQLAAVRRAEDELVRTGRRGASDAEIAARAELSETTVRSLRAAAHVTASLDEPVAEDSTRLGDLIGDERAPRPATGGDLSTRTATNSERWCACCRRVTEEVIARRAMALTTAAPRVTRRSASGSAWERSAVGRSSERGFTGCARCQRGRSVSQRNAIASRFEWDEVTDHEWNCNRQDRRKWAQLADATSWNPLAACALQAARADRSGARQASRKARRERAEPVRGPDHRVLGIDVVRLHPHRCGLGCGSVSAWRGTRSAC